MEKYQLKMFFHELLRLAYKHSSRTYGYPCEGLLEKMCLHQDRFLNRIVGDYTYRDHEVRLNNAGLKLYWRIDRDRRFSCHIGGDQREEYLSFVYAANTLIQQRRLEK